MLQRPNTEKVKAGDRPSADSHNLLTSLANSFSSGQHIQGIADSTGFHQRRSPTISQIRIAYCKDDAGAGETIDCYLDEDVTGAIVEVNFSIAQAGSDMNACLPLLANGDMIFVSEIQGAWWCPQTFNESIACDCYTAP